jgi:hypothetical protein
MLYVRRSGQRGVLHSQQSCDPSGNMADVWWYGAVKHIGSYQPSQGEADVTSSLQSLAVPPVKLAAVQQIATLGRNLWVGDIFGHGFVPRYLSSVLCDHVKVHNCASFHARKTIECSRIIFSSHLDIVRTTLSSSGDVQALAHARPREPCTTAGAAPLRGRI